MVPLGRRTGFRYESNLGSFCMSLPKVAAARLVSSLSLIFATFAWTGVAARGIWTWDNSPLKKTQKVLGRSPDPASLMHSARASAKLARWTVQRLLKHLCRSFLRQNWRDAKCASARFSTCAHFHFVTQLYGHDVASARSSYWADRSTSGL